MATLSNGEGSKNGNKQDFISKTTTSHMHHAAWFVYTYSK